jgi:hypothetical protein
MNWINEKNKIFEDFYAPLFLENGFKKRGWEFYKEIEKDKLGIVVKLNSSGNNLSDSVSFWILLGIKFNLNYPEKLKVSNITLYKCEIQFGIMELLYPQENETVILGEYWYNLGRTHNSIGKDIGSKEITEHQFYGASEGKEINIKEKISEKYIKYSTQTFNRNNKLLNKKEYIGIDTSNRYDTNNINDIMRQINEDMKMILNFKNEIMEINNFIKTDTSELIPNKIKNKIIKIYKK